MIKKIFIVVALLIAFTSNTNASGDILTESKEFNGHYYKIFKLKVNWDNAKKFCESVGGHLLIEESDEEHSFVLSMVKNKGQVSHYWIGGYKDSNGIWKWVNGDIIYNGKYWGHNQPSSNQKYNRILINSQYLVWYSENNNPRYYEGFICEWENKESAHESNL